MVVVDVPEIRLARNIFALRPRGATDTHTRLFLDLLAEALEGLPGVGPGAAARRTPGASG
ncbi:hypothetical protein GCM10027449_29670 [Sinomonas notoginsengisoli]